LLFPFLLRAALST